MAINQSDDGAIIRKAMDAEFLDAETELELAHAWRDERDEKARHRLITAYMRLAISMASKVRRYNAPMNDLIQEASLGLLSRVTARNGVLVNAVFPPSSRPR